jgi:predicted acetyltransferase
VLQKRGFGDIMRWILLKEPVMLKLVPVRAEERELLWNINQKYLYEMTNFYPDEMDGEGNLHYGYFDEYFRDPKRKAFFIFNDEKMVGFVMIHPYSMMNLNIDYSIAEFTIFPSYRKNGYAKEAVNLIVPASYRGFK